MTGSAKEPFQSFLIQIPIGLVLSGWISYFPFIIAIIWTHSSCIALFVDVGVEGVPRSIYDSTHIQFSLYELCMRNVYMREA